MIIGDCADCVRAVCADAALLEGGSWRVGDDGRQHWTRPIGDVRGSPPGFVEVLYQGACGKGGRFCGGGASER